MAVFGALVIPADRSPFAAADFRSTKRTWVRCVAVTGRLDFRSRGAHERYTDNQAAHERAPTL